jgi:hypothetical protein
VLLLTGVAFCLKASAGCVTKPCSTPKVEEVTDEEKTHKATETKPLMVKSKPIEPTTAWISRKAGEVGTSIKNGIQYLSWSVCGKGNDVSDNKQVNIQDGRTILRQSQ